MRIAVLVLVLATLAVAAGGTGASAANITYDPVLAFSSLFFSKACDCSVDHIKNWNCGSTCNFHPHFKTRNVFYNATLQSLGFTGYDYGSSTIVVSFRGSETLLSLDLERGRQGQQLGDVELR